MTCRIVVFGTESTGKTTLAQWLGQRFDAPVAQEYVREFWDRRHGYITAADLPMIARRQIAAEEEAAHAARGLLIADTDLLTSLLWFDLLFAGRCPPWVRSAAENRCRRVALYLLCDIDIGFAADPQRSFPNYADRQMLNTHWRRALIERGLPFVDVSGHKEQREAIAAAAIQQRLSDTELRRVAAITCSPRRSAE